MTLTRTLGSRLWIAVVVLFLGAVGLNAQAVNALPPIGTPFAGDPRLEPVPSTPLTMVDLPAWANGTAITMQFPPRVNGQAQSDGDGNADMYVLFYNDNGDRVPQPVILEAVPYGAAAGVTDLIARLFSPVWRLRAVLVSRAYDPNNLPARLDSVAKLTTSDLVTNVYGTNVCVSAFVIPAGSTPTAQTTPISGYFQGQTVQLGATFVNDGVSPPQTLFKFVDAQGRVLPSLTSPQLVASRTAGNSFYSTVWELWTVRVPAGTDVTTLKSRTQFLNTGGVPLAGFKVSAAGIRINAPVTSVNGTPIAFEDPFRLITDANGRFTTAKFPFDLAQTGFFPQRTVLIAETGFPVIASSPGSFPIVDPFGKGNVIPVLLKNPFQTVTSGPNTTGPRIRINQADLDAAAQNSPPLLPPAVETNIASLISAGLLSSTWAPGVLPYQSRLALLGRAINEFVYQPADGANSKDVTSCNACHSRSRVGGTARSLFDLPTNGTERNAGSFWGSGAAELLNSQERATGIPGLTFAHGSMGTSETLRSFSVIAPNTHFGLQSAEFVANQTGHAGGFDATTDFDHDGIANEKSVGEVTAETAWMMTLPVPDQASAALLQILGLDAAAVSEGKRRFRSNIDNGGAACFTCHKVFHPMSSNVFPLKNPETASVTNLTLTTHFADADDVSDGLAQFVGQTGLRLYGDFKKHKMGSLMAASGTDTMKTAEVWDAGISFPYLRAGDGGADLHQVILDHEGVNLSNITIVRGRQQNTTSGGVNISNQAIQIKNNGATTIPASASQPIRVILEGTVTSGVTARNSGAAPDGTKRQGAFWNITTPIAPGGTATLQLSFVNPVFAALQYDLAVQKFTDYSEAAFSARGFRDLSPALQQNIVDFLRAQVVADAVEQK
jgi:hypothetical protein